MLSSGIYDTEGNSKQSDCEGSTDGYNGNGSARRQRKRKRTCFRDCLPAVHGLSLDQTLWSRLPLELLERVIENLPIDALLRFRTVCKAWKAHISSYRYAELCYKTPNEGPWCLTIIPDFEAIAVYDVALDRWHQLPFPSTAAKYNMQPFSSGGGVVCFRNVNNSKFFVYNPLTRSCSNLTPNRWSTSSDRDKVWVVTDQSEVFILVVVKESGRYEVYDSYSNQWNKPRMLPQIITIHQESIIPSRSVSSDGILYMVSKFPYDLVTYDTITGSWSKLYVRWPEQSWNHILSEYGGRIYMLAFQMENEHVSFCEWEFRSQGMSWVKVDSMPNSFCHEVFGDESKGWQVNSLANRDLVLLHFSKTESQEYLILYNRILKLWRKVSNVPTFSDRVFAHQCSKNVT